MVAKMEEFQLRILLDIRHRRTLSGSVSYIYNILPHLLSRSSDFEFIVLRYEGQEMPKGAECESIILQKQSGPMQVVYDQVILPKLIRKIGTKVYHPLKYLGSTSPPCPQVTTLHAITEPFRGEFPTNYMEAFYWRYLGRRILHSSAHVIAVSEYIRDFLEVCIGISREIITVIPNGIDLRFRSLGKENSLSRDNDQDYILTVGNIFPVKNFIMAVNVLGALAREYPTLRLKMAGSTDHPYYKRIWHKVKLFELLDRVDFLGYVKPEKLVSLMNGARFLMIPSLTEGCPVTLLEAMACGTPVIGSRRGGIPEVGRDAIFLVDDPHDQKMWIEAAQKLLTDKKLCDKLSIMAGQRASEFSWAKAADATIDVYRRLIS